MFDQYKSSRWRKSIGVVMLKLDALKPHALRSASPTAKA